MTHDQERQYVRAQERVEREAVRLMDLTLEALERRPTQAQVEAHNEAVHKRCNGYVRCVNCGQEEWTHAYVGGWCPDACGWFDYGRTFRAADGDAMTAADREELNDIIDSEREEWAMTHCLAHGEVLRDDGTGRMYCPVCEQELEDERRQDR
jgi:hypothetical protein